VAKGQLLIDAENNEGQSWSIMKNSTVSGQIIFSGYEVNSLGIPPGYEGDRILARIRCKAGSVPGASTLVNFTFWEIGDRFGTVIPSTAVGGAFTINRAPS
jgi:hypothetical protein